MAPPKKPRTPAGKTCTFCGVSNVLEPDLIEFQGEWICPDCLAEQETMLKSAMENIALLRGEASRKTAARTGARTTRDGGLDNLGLLLGRNLVSSLNLGSFGLHGLDCLDLGSHGLVLGLVHDLFVLRHETPSWPSRASSPHSRGPSRTLCALNIHASRQNVH